MANDLVPWGPRPVPASSFVPLLHDDEEWDLPPELDPSLAEIEPPPHNSQTPTLQQRQNHDDPRALRDANMAERRGDHGYAVQRETDAAEHRQRRWDWGDARTWLWITGMCFVFFLLVVFVYFMPQGRHNQDDGGNLGGTPTPTIRVY